MSSASTFWLVASESPLCGVRNDTQLRNGTLPEQGHRNADGRQKYIVDYLSLAALSQTEEEVQRLSYVIFLSHKEYLI